MSATRGVPRQLSRTMAKSRPASMQFCIEHQFITIGSIGSTVSKIGLPTGNMCCLLCCMTGGTLTFATVMLSAQVQFGAISGS